MVTFDPQTYASWFETPLGKRVWTDERRALLRALGPVRGKKILDAGSGDGRFATELAGDGAQVTAVDASAVMCEAARMRAKKAAITLDVCEAQIEELPFPDNQFDLVVAVTVFCFVPDPQHAVSELARVLKPGGRLVIGELGRWSLWALSRRIRALRGDPVWQSAGFWSCKQLSGYLEQASLQSVTCTGAVYYPRSLWLARLLGPLDENLSALKDKGSAFLVVSGEKPALNGSAGVSLP